MGGRFCWQKGSVSKARVSRASLGLLVYTSGLCAGWGSTCGRPLWIIPSVRYPHPSQDPSPPENLPKAVSFRLVTLLHSHSTTVKTKTVLKIKRSNVVDTPTHFFME